MAALLKLNEMRSLLKMPPILNTGGLFNKGVSEALQKRRNRVAQEVLG
jgi:hypothetical protein